MSEYVDLKKIIAEARAEVAKIGPLSEATMPELKDHHGKISDLLDAGGHSPEVHAKLQHVHERLTNTLDNVQSEIDKHEEMAEYHDEHSYGSEAADPPHDHRDFHEDESAREVRGHLRKINELHEEIAEHHGEAAEWHRQMASDLERGHVDVPEHCFDNTPYEPKKPE